MGFYGVVRFLFSFEKGEVFILLFQSVSLFGSIVAFLLALSSDDMKNSVAYSSVAHMNFAFASFLFPTENALWASWLSILAHGFCASLLFWGVTTVYSVTFSRSSLVSNGSISKFSEIQLVFFLIWSINLSPPPFFSFLGEVGSIGNLFLGLSWIGGLLSAAFVLFGSFFSVLNFLMSSHSSENPLFKGVPKGTLLLSSSVWVCALSFFLFFWPTLLFPLSD